jgi:hypothetical protein
VATMVWGVLGLAACGDRTSLTADAGAPTPTAEAGTSTPVECVAAPSTARAPRFHRACPEVCPPDFATNTPEPCAADGTCFLGYRCTGGLCTIDQCLASTDCDAGAICTCTAANPTWGSNRCSPGQCQLDSDCGDGGFCSPSADSTCAAVPQRTWRCHTANDECLDDADCDGGLCRFAPETGAWACAAITRCGG